MCSTDVERLKVHGEAVVILKSFLDSSRHTYKWV